MATEVDTDHVSFTWRAPQKPNGVLSGYRSAFAGAGVTQRKSLTCMQLITLYHYTHNRLFFDRADEAEYQEIEVPATVLGYTVKHLTPGVMYRFQGKRVNFAKGWHFLNRRPHP